MESPEPMNRLLQGDVGSGKTAVAMLALAKAAENGYQGCLMAPTEILCRAALQRNAEGLGTFGHPYSPAYGEPGASGSAGGLEGLADGTIKAVVGTYALIQDAVTFHPWHLP